VTPCLPRAALPPVEGGTGSAGLPRAGEGADPEHAFHGPGSGPCRERRLPACAPLSHSAHPEVRLCADPPIVSPPPPDRELCGHDPGCQAGDQAPPGGANLFRPGEACVGASLSRPVRLS